MGQLSIAHRDTWGRFKHNFERLIIEALLILRNQTKLAKGEVSLNRTLALCFVEANLKLCLDYQPTPEAKNFPHFDDISKVVRENNIPDFSWNIIDHINRCNRSIALECKRLGAPSSHSWKLNEQYVEAGIFRFFKTEEGYSKGCELGAMVGYVQTMEFEKILQEINDHIVALEPTLSSIVPPTKGWQIQGISFFNHQFVRQYSPPSFLLNHFWVDIRDFYTAHKEALDDDQFEFDEDDITEPLDNVSKTKSKDSKKKVEKNPTQLALPIKIED